VPEGVSLEGSGRREVKGGARGDGGGEAGSRMRRAEEGLRVAGWGKLLRALCLVI